MMGTKTLIKLIADREAKMKQLLKINQQIEDAAWDTNVDVLYTVSSKAPGFKNDNQLKLSVINGSFFRLERPDYMFEVNMTPKDFQRFIVACIEANKRFRKRKKEERRVRKLEEKKVAIDREIQNK